MRAAAALLATALLAGCATAPIPTEPPTRIPAQRLVLDTLSGSHEIVAADSAPARLLATEHPGRPVPAPMADAGVISLNNVSISLALGAVAPRAPTTEVSEEPRP
jgi:hypothetical protein